MKPPGWAERFDSISQAPGGQKARRAGRYNRQVALLGARFVLALEPSAVAGAAVARGLGGPRVRAMAQAPLPPGALAVSPFEGNLPRPEEVSAALGRVAEAIGLDGRPACVVLPDGLARLVLLELPGDVVPERFARFKLLAGLPYPPEEAVVDVLPLGGRRALAAAVRRSVVEGYEAAVEAAGIVQDRIDLAPLAALAGLGREAAGMEPSVDVILGESAVSLAARVGGEVRAFRNRLRDPSPGEVERLQREVERTAAMAGDGAGPPRVRILGVGASALLRRWRERGGDAAPGWRLSAPATSPETAEMAWLGAALA
jgi:hypothetical protein